MPNRVVVKPTDELVSIRPVRKNGKRHFMGTAALGNVTVTADGLEGDLLDEFTEVRELGENVLKHMTELVFVEGEGFGVVSVHDSDDESDDSLFDEIVMFTLVTGKTYAAAYVCGSEVFVSKR